MSLTRHISTRYFQSLRIGRPIPALLRPFSSTLQTSAKYPAMSAGGPPDHAMVHFKGRSSSFLSFGVLSYSEILSVDLLELEADG